MVEEENKSKVKEERKRVTGECKCSVGNWDIHLVDEQEEKQED